MSRALLLDVDGVLVTPPEFYSHVMERKYGIPLEVGTAFFLGPFARATTGEVTIRDLLPLFMSASGHPGTVEEFLREWCESDTHPNQPLIDAVHALDGWRVYLATNQDAYRLQYLLHQRKFQEFTHGNVASCTVGARKPDPQYYTRAAAHLNLSPEQIVFWDDSAGNVKAARDAGWHAHLYESVPHFQRVMAQYD